MKKYYLIIAFTLALFFVPIFINPNYYLGRDNDLHNFFWPIIQLVVDSLAKYRTLPFWDAHILSGTPLLPDPQSQMFYLPNIIFLILNDRLAFIVSAYLHLLIGSLFVFLIFNKLIKTKKNISIFAAVIYGISSKNAAIMIAGHFGLVNAQAWIPLVIYGSLTTSPLPLAIGMSGLYFTHTITFILAAPLSLALFLFHWTHSENKFNNLIAYIFSVVTTFGLIAITFLHQLQWAKLTSRVALQNDHQVHPIWNSFSEVVTNMLYPEYRGLEYLQSVDAEKWIFVGVGILLLSLLGFWKLKFKHKTLFLVFCATIFSLLLNNLSPVYEVLIRQNWYAYLRVSTRVWFMFYIFILGLAAYGLSKIKNKLAVYMIIIFVIWENLFVSWARITAPIETNNKYVSSEIYDFLDNDNGLYRVYCTNRCIPALEAVKRNIELVDGYSTLIQSNYYQQAQKFTGTSWDYYSLAIPPIGEYLNYQPQPDAQLLGKYNTKYIISAYKLTDTNFVYLSSVGNYLLYENRLFLPRSNAEVVKYGPNKIILNGNDLQEVVVANVYSPFWEANTPTEPLEINETDDGLIKIDNPQGIGDISLEYIPESFKIGAAITVITIFLLCVILVIDKEVVLSSKQKSEIHKE